MAKRRLPAQQQLLSDLLALTGVREDIERLLAHVVRVQAETISAAVAYGVKQTELADVAQLSRQRVGQIADEIDPTLLDLASLNRQAGQVEGWPGNVMSALAGLQFPSDQEDPARAETRYRQIAVVYGEDEARARADRRTAYLSSLPSKPEDQAMHEEQAQRNHRTVYGDSGR